MPGLDAQPSVARIVGATNPEKTPIAPIHLAQSTKKARREWKQQPQGTVSLVLVILVFIFKSFNKIDVKL
jgi:hypothetical protein